MNEPYEVGDIVLANAISLLRTGEVVIIVRVDHSKRYPYQWGKHVNDNGTWMPVEDILRRATPEEIAAFQGANEQIIMHEIEKHRKAIEILETKLKTFTSAH